MKVNIATVIVGSTIVHPSPTRRAHALTPILLRRSVYPSRAYSDPHPTAIQVSLPLFLSIRAYLSAPATTSPRAEQSRHRPPATPSTARKAAEKDIDDDDVAYPPPSSSHTLLGTLCHALPCPRRTSLPLPNIARQTSRNGASTALPRPRLLASGQRAPALVPSHFLNPSFVSNGVRAAATLREPVLIPYLGTNITSHRRGAYSRFPASIVHLERPSALRQPTTSSATTSPRSCHTRRSPSPSTSLLRDNLNSRRYGRTSSAERRKDWIEWEVRGSSGLDLRIRHPFVPTSRSRRSFWTAVSIARSRASVAISPTHRRGAYRRCYTATTRQRPTSTRPPSHLLHPSFIHL
ncbi:hypothetical protein BJ912DRAFT_1064682 [Pholiota molesta]|nr:hypothetical protein BJ912DRAFT_1064682 [Pholiota molesta]